MVVITAWDTSSILIVLTGTETDGMAMSALYQVKRGNWCGEKTLRKCGKSFNLASRNFISNLKYVDLGKSDHGIFNVVSEHTFRCEYLKSGKLRFCGSTHQTSSQVYLEAGERTKTAEGP